MSTINLYLFGPPRLEQAGEPVRLVRRKAKALLAYVLLNPQEHSREALAAFFWPEYDHQQARADLSRMLSVLSKHLGKTWLNADRDIVAITPEFPFWVDVLHFQHLLARCERHPHSPEQVCEACLPNLSEAVTLYQADFLAGFTLADGAAFDDWQMFQTETLRQALAGALERLGQGYGRQGQWETALNYAKRWASIEPLHEAAHRQLMTLYALNHQRAAALAQYELCQRLLATELEMAPDAETQALFERIQAGALNPERKLEPAPGQVGLMEARFGPAHNLPHPTTSFVGRQAELDTIIDRLSQPDCRLVSIVGPGGMGKTRLALQVARSFTQQTGPAFGDGVFMASLATVSTAEQVPLALAGAVGLPLSGAKASIDQLVRYLQSKNVLLLLDNFEHLVDEATLLADILQAVSEVKVLVTSRIRLNLYEEWLIDLSGLEAPGPETPLAQALDYNAVQLFLQRARQIKSDFSLTEANGAAMRDICHALEGMPLAIELAAAWVRTHPCRDIAHQIQHNLDFLSTSLRNIPERQRSLRAAFEHSWQLLDQHEQAAFARLSVFRGGFTAEAATVVAGISPQTLASLVDKSLLQQNRGNRYDVHQLLRQFGAEKLAGDSACAAAHARYFAGVFQQQEQAFISGDSAANDQVAIEIDNIRTAWHWAAGHTAGAMLDGLLGTVAAWCEVQGWFQEGRSWLTEAIESVEPASTEQESLLLGRLEESLARFHDHLGQYEEAKTHAERSLDHFRQFETPAFIAGAQAVLGFALSALGDNLTAQTMLQDSLQTFEQLGHQRGQAEVLYFLSFIATGLGDTVGGLDCVEKSLALYRQLGDRRNTARGLFLLGNYQIGAGQFAQALAYYEKSKGLHQQLGHRVGVAECLKNEAHAAFFLGQFDQAERSGQAALKLFTEFGDANGIAGSLENLGRVAAQRGDYPLAKHYLEQSLSGFQTTGNTLRVGLAHSFLGNVLVELGEFEAARSHFRSGLELGLAAKAVTHVLICLLEMHHFLTTQDMTPMAIETVAHVAEHITEIHYRDRARQHLAALSPSVPTETFTALVKKGRAASLEALVMTTLAAI
jgi:predicted ATPase/DNA-binding SARP family transcriptional activator